MKKETNTTEKIISAKDKTLGRVATEIAHILMGKNKASYERNVYSGSPVKVTDASKLKITTKKLAEIYHVRYSGYPGGFRQTQGTETKEKKGLKELIRLATYQMLPDNKLRREMMKHLTIEE